MFVWCAKQVYFSNDRLGSVSQVKNVHMCKGRRCVNNHLCWTLLITKVHIKARGVNWMISYHLYCLGLNCRIDDLVKKPYCTLRMQLQVK